ncbi:MAG: hypothetical protein GY851_03385 [bacterium]|nr:hypothetical protein [bacterium]
MPGIKETREVVTAMGDVGAVIAGLLKDGFQPGSDIMALFMSWQTNPELKASLTAAGDNISAVKDEIKDLDVGEGLELGKEGINTTQKILAALK